MMAKNSFLMKQLFCSKTAQKQNLRGTDKDDCPKLTSIMLILVLAMLAGVFLVKALT
ncbi:hypothetical protein KHQ08_09750 [Pseudochrobactrum algeriensis]|uniref:hypothetical protein n=2 Tax=Pseudochrobactrum algeriensis TaxID=2834768 RepID=UPI001BCFF9B1|nr:hypothetical protein [Pseudochrobactrum algeriensis]QVQ38233.1 hypothetical protein KHQ08_09750 [Pseudochrobactrum algeriensis]QVQ41459.1 hypothetical protein KHQ07_08055 [Pseudochrobactrum algeriensis]QVQ45381.1 hypothetical protein KHQ09_10010 [Pseudochrobactrum algeriensis]